MRTLKLTHKEIEIIEEALTSYYNQGIKLINDKSDYINTDTRKLILKDVNEKDDLRMEISEGQKDI